MRFGLDQTHDLVERRIGGNRGDIDPRHHDVGHGLVAQLQDVGEENALIFTDRRIALRRLLDQLLDRFANGFVLFAPPEATQDCTQQPAIRGRLGDQ